MVLNQHHGATFGVSSRSGCEIVTNKPNSDKDRDGFVMGDGAGVMMLEEYEHAKARGAKIYAEIVGFGMSGDAYHMTSPSADGSGGALAMEACLRDAGINADQLGYINAHGTSTPVGDVQEIEAIKKVFSSQGYLPKITSTKSLTGHSLGATGVHEAIYTLIMMNGNFISGSSNIEIPDPIIEDLDIPRETVDNVEINTAFSNSFGFGGTNATLVMQKYKRLMQNLSK